MDDQKYLSDAKYKQFIVAIDKSLKNFEYSSEWADLISCLGKLNKVIQTYSQYPVIPRKLLIGKRLAQCLHPALPSGVHLKALESYGYIFTQIGPQRLAQDLFIYSIGLFPLLSEASIAVKPVLLDLYENHFLPLKKKLYPGLTGVLLALLPGIEEVSEFTERTTAIVFNLCESTDEKVFFSCLWDGVLHSTQIRLSAMTFVMGYMAKKPGQAKQGIMGSDINLMVNAICSCFVDSNVLVQRMTLDLAISFITFHSSTLSRVHLVKLLTYALDVLLRRDMSLNRRIFQWLLNMNSDGTAAGAVLNTSTSMDDPDEEVDENVSYFHLYTKELLIASVVTLFQDVLKKSREATQLCRGSHSKNKLSYLKPFRILITLLDKPEIGSAILEDVMIEVFRTLYEHVEFKNELVNAKDVLHVADINAINEELIKYANLLFNSFEPFFMWDYLSRTLERCNEQPRESSNEDHCLVAVRHPTHKEIFQLINYLLDIVLLETATETQSEHWPNLLKQVILEMINNVSLMDMDTLLIGIHLMSKLLSRLSPIFIGGGEGSHETTASQQQASQKSPSMSPSHQQIELLNKASAIEEESNNAILECIRLSKNLFSVFVDSRVMKKNHAFLSIFHHYRDERGKFELIQVSDETKKTNNSSDDDKVAKSFQIFCRFIVQLSCFPVVSPEPNQDTSESILDEWLQVLIMCCCNGQSFDIQGSALSCFLDLINVTYTVEISHNSNTDSKGSIAPLISLNSMSWLEKSNLYRVIASCLWNRISPKNCQYHQATVELFLRLHNCTATSNVAEDVISNALKEFKLCTKELSHWRFSVLWHLSRDFYKDDNNKSNRGTRTIDKCMLLMIDSLESEHVKIRECIQGWLKHSIHFGDVGRILETLLLILLHPSSARLSIHYVQLLKLKKQFPDGGEIGEALTIKNEMDDGSSSDDEEKDNKMRVKQVNSTNSSTVTSPDNDKSVMDGSDKTSPQSPTEEGMKNMKYLKTHPLLIHKLLYTQHYDTSQCLYALKRISMILKSEGRSFIVAVATTSMSVCNTPHQTLLRELLIRHRRVLSGKEFYGSLAEAHQLLIRASTAKYLEILLSVCLYFIRSEFHDSLDASNDTDGNFAVQAASAQVLTQISYLLLEIARDTGKSFSTYINDLLTRSKIQRISLHCLLSTVYSVTSDYRESCETGYYSMVDCANISEYTDKPATGRSLLDLQVSLLKFIESLIFLESCIGTENVANAHTNSKKSKNKEKNPANSSNVQAYEYVQYKPIVSQPMFISAILSVLAEKRWMHLHSNWIKLVITCLPKFSDDMSMTVVPVVNQICTNLKIVTKLLRDSRNGKRIDTRVELLPDYMLIMLDGLTSFCHYCLIGTNTDAALLPGSGSTRTKLKGDDSGSSLFTDIVRAFSSSPMVPLSAADINSKAVSDTREGLLKILPSILTAVLNVWQAWDVNNLTTTPQSLVSETPVAVGQPKSVRLAILQLITPIAMNHTVPFLASVANVWSSYRDLTYTKPSPSLRGKDWLAAVNKRLLPDPTVDQKNILDVVEAIKVLTLETITETSKQVLKQFSGKKDQSQSQSLEFCCAHFLYQLLLRTTHQDTIQVKASLMSLLKEALAINLSPPTLFVLFAILNIYVQRVPVPDERRARRDLQDIALKFLETLNNVAGSSLEGSAWFRRSLQVVAHVEQNSELDESFVSSEKSSIPETQSSVNNTAKNSQYSVPVILIMAEYLAPMLDMLYLSEEKDKIPSALIYLMYNIFPYLKNHSQQNCAGYRACSALLAAISDYQYTLRAWRKDVYELFLDNDFFQIDILSFSFWRSIIDHLITYDNTVFKDLMQRISLSQSGAINIFANREQEMEQRAQLLKRLSFIIFCGDFDQYAQYLPDIQERISESIRQLQGPVLHEQVFLCFRVLLTRMSPNQLVSFWPPILTELVLVFVHMEHELSSAGKSKSKSRISMLESFLGINGYFKDPNKWLRVYLAVCKLLDFLLVLPSDILPHYQVYKWAFSETPGVYCASLLDDMGSDASHTAHTNKEDIASETKIPARMTGMAKPIDEVSKMSELNKPIAQRKKQTAKEKQSRKNTDSSKQEQLASVFFPYISRIVKLLRQQNTAEGNWDSEIRKPGQLIVLQSKILSLYDLLGFFLGVTGDLAAGDVDVSKMSQFNMADVETLIEKDLTENVPNVV